MELFERAKAIMFNPKEEWKIIEAENASHGKVFAGYLLILALIPTVAIFISYCWKWYSASHGLVGFFDSPYLKLGIAVAVQPFVIILVGAYLSAAVINAFSDQFGSAKDLNRAFSLVAYSYTPMCVAGILFIFGPLAAFVPYVGLYGLVLLYFGIEAQLKPSADKKIICFIITLITALVAWIILSKIVPVISQSILEEMAKSNSNDAIRNMMPR